MLPKICLFHCPILPSMQTVYFPDDHEQSPDTYWLYSLYRVSSPISFSYSYSLSQIPLLKCHHRVIRLPAFYVSAFPSSGHCSPDHHKIEFLLLLSIFFYQPFNKNRGSESEKAGSSVNTGSRSNVTSFTESPQNILGSDKIVSINTLRYLFS